MDKKKLISRINNVFKDKIIVYEGKILSSEEVDYNAQTNIKFEITGSDTMIRVGQKTEYLKIKIEILSTTNPILKLFMENNVDFNLIYFMKNNLENYFEKTLEIFGFKYVIITDVKYPTL